MATQWDRRTAWTRALPNAHFGRPEVQPDVGVTFAANLADEPRLEIGKPHVVGPAIGRECD